MKAWEELSADERREVIGRRLGWTRGYISTGERCGWDGPSGQDELTLPEWPTDDGLAFADVWPRMLSRNSDLCLSLFGSKGMNPSVRSVDWSMRIGGLAVPHKRPVAEADTWAEAICRAAYELLPESS